MLRRDWWRLATAVTGQYAGGALLLAICSLVLWHLTPARGVLAWQLDGLPTTAWIGSWLLEGDMQRLSPALFGRAQPSPLAMPAVLTVAALAWAVPFSLVGGLAEWLTTRRRSYGVRIAWIGCWAIPFMAAAAPEHGLGPVVLAGGAGLVGAVLSQLPRQLGPGITAAVLAAVLVVAFQAIPPLAMAAPRGYAGPTPRLMPDEPMNGVKGRSLEVGSDWKPAGSPPFKAPEHVVMLGIDTLGAKHMSVYGYDRKTTPELARFAEQEAILFEDVTASTSWTLPSMVTLFTSINAEKHGAEKGVERIPSAYTTLASAYAAQDFTTGAFVTNLYVTERYDMHRGFHEFWDLTERRFGSHKQVKAGAVNERAFSWLRRHRDERFFLYVHYIDPHADYEAPPPFAGRWSERNYPKPKVGTSSFLKPYHSTSRMMGEQDLRQVEGMYDEEVAYMDHQLGRVFDELRRLELWEDSLVVVVSDHGEEFQEHRSMEHGHNLYEETLHIPLLVKPPGGRPDGMRKRVSEHVGLVDVARSMLHMSALSIPPSFDGRSLVPLMRRRGEDRDVLASLDAAHWHMDALVHGHYKWILDEESDEQELYDLSTDPGETRSLVHTRLELAERMRALYKEAHARAHGSDEAEPGKVDLTEEEKDKLRALGYVQ